MAISKTDPPAGPAPELSIERPREGLALVRLNRPQARNSLSAALRRQIIAAFDDLGHKVTVIILTGAGDTFCAGLDLKELNLDAAVLTAGPDDDPVAAVRRFPGVVIGAINGAAVTGGLELALACDILVASDQARFADTHLRVGAIPGWQLSQRLSRTIGLYRAKHMALTGEFISADTAAAWGLVSETVPGDRLLDRARAIADAVLQLPTSSLQTYKSLIDDGYGVTLHEGLLIEAQRARSHNSAFDQH